jgi:hypothetical protein
MYNCVNRFFSTMVVVVFYGSYWSALMTAASQPSSDG